MCDQGNSIEMSNMNVKDAIHFIESINISFKGEKNENYIFIRGIKQYYHVTVHLRKENSKLSKSDFVGTSDYLIPEMPLVLLESKVIRIESLHYVLGSNVIIKHINLLIE